MRYNDQGQECTGQGGVMDYGYWTTINRWSHCSRDDFASRVNSVGYCFSCPSGRMKEYGKNQKSTPQTFLSPLIRLDSTCCANYPRASQTTVRKLWTPAYV